MVPLIPNHANVWIVVLEALVTSSSFVEMHNFRSPHLMSLLRQPLFFLLDTRSLNWCADHPSDPSVLKMLGFVRTGDVIPFLTSHMLEELASHRNRDVFLRRVDVLSKMHGVSFLKLPHDNAYVGSILHLREHELAHLLENPESNLEETIDAVRPKAITGFESGEKLVNNNFSWWEHFHEELADPLQAKKEEHVNLTHFNIEDPDQPLPDPDTVIDIVSEPKMGEHLFGLAEKLAGQIQKLGECRQEKDHTGGAHSLMRETFDEGLPKAGKTGTSEDLLMRPRGIKPDRLPSKPTLGDACFEAIFVANLQTHSRRMNLPAELLLEHIRKERVPSWMVWQETSTQMRSIPRASIGNINDALMASFGPYLDVIDVDKRTRDSIKKASRRHPLLAAVLKKVPDRSGFGGLVEFLERRING
jgi:hypothetical protein